MRGPAQHEFTAFVAITANLILLPWNSQMHPVIIIADDTLFTAGPWQELPAFSSQRAMEFEHLQHFKRVANHKLPRLKFRLMGDGADPPDFVISRGLENIGLELTAFAIPVQRAEAAFFSQISDRLLTIHAKGRLRRLRGIDIEVTFRDVGGRPFRVDDVGIEAMANWLEALGPIKIDVVENTVMGGRQFPMGECGQHQGLLWEITGISNTPNRGTRFSEATGFSIGYSHRPHFTIDQVRSMLQATIDRKDIPRSAGNELLVAIGAPAKDGRAFISETLLAKTAISGWAGLGGLNFEVQHRATCKVLHKWEPTTRT